MKWHDQNEDCLWKLPASGTKSQYIANLITWQNMKYRQWKIDRRPYYSVMQQVGEALSRIKLDIPSDTLKLPIDTLLIRFPVGGELGISDGRQLASMLVFQDELPPLPDSESQVNMRQFLICPQFEKGRYGCMCIVFKPGLTVEENLSRSVAVVKTADAAAMTDTCVRLLCSLCLLDEDSDLLTPDVLADDQVRYDNAATNEERERIVRRAVKRGKYGWTIGKNLEVSPHFRRPHFGIRWTQKGRSVPKIVPIKGCVVKREKIGHVPTGYMDAPLCTSCKMLPAVDGNECAECLKVVAS